MAVEFYLYSFVASATEPGLSTGRSASRNVIGSRLGLTAVRDDVAGMRDG